MLNVPETSKYRPGQTVYLLVPGRQQLEGPLKIETVPSARKYTLSHPDGQQARGGEEIDETDLTDSNST
jgi:hypothetical protein